MVAGLHIIVALLVWWRWMFRRDDILTAMAMGILVVVKVIAGYLLTDYYLVQYGGGDMHGYMSDARLLGDFFHRYPAAFFRLIFLGDESSAQIQQVLPELQIWYDSGFRGGYNDAQTVTRFHALLTIVTEGNLWLHLLWSNVLAVFGIRWLLGFFLTNPENRKIPLWTWLIALLPNVLLWGSPVLKEPLLLFVMGALLRTMVLLKEAKTLRNLILFSLVLTGFCLLKYFWLLILLPGVITFIAWPAVKESEWKMTLVYASCFLLVMIVGHIVPVLHLPSLLYGQQLNMWRFAVFMKAGSLLDPVPFAPTDWSLIRFMPYAFIYALVQPLPAQISSSVMWPMFAESLVASVLLLIAFVIWVRKGRGYVYMASFGVIAGAAILVISGLTTPVLGTLVRYRMPGVLLLVLAALNVIVFSGKRKATM